MATNTGSKKKTTTKKKTTAKKTTAKKSAASKKTPRKRTAKKAVPKKAALKAVPKTEKEIVEAVYNERNLSNGLETLSQAQQDEIRAMGEAMLRGEQPKQKSIAKNAQQQAILDTYSNIIQSTMDEVMNLSEYAPREEVLELAHSNPQALVALRDAEPWTVHRIGTQHYLKTGVNTIELVRDYIFKLEKVVLRYQQDAANANRRYDEMLEIKDEAIDLYRKEVDNYRNGGFWSLIKLAFSRLFKGESNG